MGDFCGILLCSPTLEDILSQADLVAAERTKVRGILLGERFGLKKHSRDLRGLAIETPSGLVNAGLTVREANALLAVVPGAHGGELLGDLIDGCPAIRVERRPIVKDILRSLGYDNAYRRGTALQLLTRFQLLAAEICSEGQSADGTPVKLSAEEADAILSLAWHTNLAPSYAPRTSRSGDSADIEKLRREYQNQVELVEKEPWTNEMKDVVRYMYRLAFDSRRRDKIHTVASLYYGVWTSFISWILLLTSVGATIVAAVGSTRSTFGIRIATLILTAITALASGWTSIVSPAAKAQQHRSAAAKYYSLASDLRECVLQAKSRLTDSKLAKAKAEGAAEVKADRAVEAAAEGAAEATAGAPAQAMAEAPSPVSMIDQLVKFRARFNAIGAASPDCPFWAVGQKKVEFRYGNPGLWAMNWAYWLCGPFCGSVVGEAGGQGPSFKINGSPV